MVRRFCPFFLALLCCVGCQVPEKTAFNRVEVKKALPEDVSLDDVVHAYSPVDKFTVEHELIDLGAHVNKDGKLVDGEGKEIRFFHETHCWGTPPPNYDEEQRQEAERFANLAENYTVVTITANPSGIPTP
jgi:hypothetical protein